MLRFGFQKSSLFVLLSSQRWETSTTRRSFRTAISTSPGGELSESLKARGYTDVFLDPERLEAGREWNKALLKDLVSAEHLIVIWSSNAKASEWVAHERARLEAARDKDNSRLIIHINSTLRPMCSQRIRTFNSV